MPYEEEDLTYGEPALDALAHDLIGAAIEVHRKLGPGLDESLYENALAFELTLRGIPFTRQVNIDVTYKGQVIGQRRLDFIIDEKLVVELKAVEQLAPLHQAQVRTYLKITRLQLGILLNFNTAILKDGIKRIVSS